MLNLKDGTLWQWDTGRKIIVTLRDGHTIDKVQFYNGIGENAYPATSIETVNGEILAGIPNSLLCYAKNLTVYLMTTDEDGVKTQEQITLAVNRRAKPEDYIFSDDEFHTYVLYDERLQYLEKNVVLPDRLKESTDTEVKALVPEWSREVAPDVTLTKAGEAADAAKVGNAISKLEKSVSSPYNSKGSVASVDELPSEDNVVNDTYYVTGEKSKYTWNGTEWYQSSMSEAEYAEELSQLRADMEAADSQLSSEIGEIGSGVIPFDLIANKYINQSGVINSKDGWSMTNNISCKNMKVLFIISSVSNSEYNVFFDGNGQVISSFGVCVGRNEIIVPNNAKTFVLSNTTDGMNGTKIMDSGLYANTILSESQIGIDLFDESLIVYNKNAQFNPNTKRAVSEPIFLDGDTVTIHFNNIPSNINYGINGYETTKGESWVGGTPWLNVPIYEYGGFNYIRLIFGTKDDTDLTPSSLDGLNISVYRKGNVLTEYKPTKIKVCSYNVGKYYMGNDGGVVDGAIDKLKKFICKNDFDILGLQESKDTVNGVNLNTDVFGYLYEDHVTTDNWSALHTKTTIESKYVSAFESDNLTRMYVQGFVNINGKKVFIISCHFGLTEDVRNGCFEELMAKLSDKKSFIIFGDFNNANDNYTAEKAQAEINKFINAGCNVANGGFLGLMNTQHSNMALDNIITSSDIKIVNSGTMEELYSEMFSDHYPIYAELLI